MLDSRPAFLVQIVRGTHRGSPAPRLAWAGNGGGTIEQRLKLVGVYGCYRLHDGGPLIEPAPMVTIPRALAVEIVDAFRHRVVNDAAVDAIQKAIYGGADRNG